MSAYIVQDATINRILGAGRTAAERGSSPGMPRMPRALEPPPDDRAAWAELGARMHALNVRAVQVRYGDDAAVMGMDNDGYVYIPQCPGEGVATSKALACFLYQCCEGNVPADPLFEALSAWQATLDHAIVCGLPEWERAPWG